MGCRRRFGRRNKRLVSLLHLSQSSRWAARAVELRHRLHEHVVRAQSLFERGNQQGVQSEAAGQAEIARRAIASISDG